MQSVLLFFFTLLLFKKTFSILQQVQNNKSLVVLRLHSYELDVNRGEKDEMKAGSKNVNVCYKLYSGPVSYRINNNNKTNNQKEQ